MKEKDVQAALLQAVAEKLPEHVSLPKHLEDVANASRATAYRKASGESSLSFQEAILLSQHHNISLDKISSRDEIAVPGPNC